MALRQARHVGLTDDQRRRFERDGYLVVEDALDATHVSRLIEAVDRVWPAHRDAPPVAGAEPLHLLAFVGRNRLFPRAPGPRARPAAGGRPARVERVHAPLSPGRTPSDARPVAAVVDVAPGRRHPEPRPGDAPTASDVGEGGVLPDRRRRTGPRELLGHPRLAPARHDPRPPDDDNDVAGAVPVLARPGTAVLFDRRLWHMRGENRSSLARKALFYAYTYRWVRPRDDIRIAPELFGTITPIRAQLLGAGSSAIGHWMPDDADAPLRRWWDVARGGDGVAAPPRG